MDESWQVRMGVGMRKGSTDLPRRKSTDETSSRTIFGHSETTLYPEDFNDVFGGPPRSVLAGQFSNGNVTTRSILFYDEVFRPTGNINSSSVTRSCRSSPESNIPASGGCGRRSEDFYSDIFRSKEDVRRSRSRSVKSSKSMSKSKSKSTSSSVLSSEELGLLRPVIGCGDDLSFSLFASKLRPINVLSRWRSSTMMHDEHPREPGIATFSCSRPSSVENPYLGSEDVDIIRSCNFGFSRHVASPETISLESNSFGSVKVLVDDLELNTTSSIDSSLGQGQEIKACKIQDEELQEQGLETEEDEVMSSYVIEINPFHRDGTDDEPGIDEAIAWAKRRFQPQFSDKDIWNVRQPEEHAKEPEDCADRPEAHQFVYEGSGRESVCSPKDKKPKKWSTDDEGEQLDKEVEAIDERIRLWSTGKEANIKLLLSTLHHILWPNSGWCTTPLTHLVESSQVKKAYQKARLCLHPDKLQQRGATLAQKQAAEKAFSILQDAWTAFISQGVLVS